jgi:hypothetical protein
MTLPRMRVHDVLGWAIQPRPGDKWVFFLRSSGESQGKTTDAFVHKDGWRDLDVREMRK